MRPPRWAGQPKYTFRRSLRLALEGVTAFSLFPLRLVAIFGLFVMAASFAFGLFTLCWQLLGGHTVRGWTSLMICVHFFGGLPTRDDRDLERVPGPHAGPGEGEAALYRAVRVRPGVVEPSREPTRSRLRTCRDRAAQDCESYHPENGTTNSARQADRG